MIINNWGLWSPKLKVKCEQDLRKKYGLKKCVGSYLKTLRTLKISDRFIYFTLSSIKLYWGPVLYWEPFLVGEKEDEKI